MSLQKLPGDDRDPSPFTFSLRSKITKLDLDKQALNINSSRLNLIPQYSLPPNIKKINNTVSGVPKIVIHPRLNHGFESAFYQGDRIPAGEKPW
jgi:hypothetical protein